MSAGRCLVQVDDAGGGGWEWRIVTGPRTRRQHRISSKYCYARRKQFGGGGVDASLAILQAESEQAVSALLRSGGATRWRTFGAGRPTGATGLESSDGHCSLKPDDTRATRRRSIIDDGWFVVVVIVCSILFTTSLARYLVGGLARADVMAVL